MTMKSGGSASFSTPSQAVPSQVSQLVSHGKDISGLEDKSARPSGWQHLSYRAESISGSEPRALSHWHFPQGFNSDECVATLLVHTPAFDDSGAAHALEHWVLRGSGKYPNPDDFFMLRSTLIFSEFNASTEPERTCFHLSSQDKPCALKMLDYLACAVLSPLLTDSDFELEILGHTGKRGVLFREMQAYLAKPEFALKQSLYSGNRFLYGGVPDTIRKLSPQMLRQVWQYWYRPEHMTLVTAGDWDLTAVARVFHRALTARQASLSGEPGSIRLPEPVLAGLQPPAHLRLVVEVQSRDIGLALHQLLSASLSQAQLLELGWRWLCDDESPASPALASANNTELYFVPLGASGDKAKLQAWLASKQLELERDPDAVLRYCRESEQQRFIAQSRKQGKSLARLYQCFEGAGAEFQFTRLVQTQSQHQSTANNRVKPPQSIKDERRNTSSPKAGLADALLNLSQSLQERGLAANLSLTCESQTFSDPQTQSHSALLGIAVTADMHPALPLISVVLQHSLVPARVAGQLYGYGDRISFEPDWECADSHDDPDSEMGVLLVYTGLDMAPEASIQAWARAIELAAAPDSQQVMSDELTKLLPKAAHEWLVLLQQSGRPEPPSDLEHLILSKTQALLPELAQAIGELRRQRG